MNYRRNEDKLCNNGEAGFNAIHNVEDITGSGIISEPVTVEEAKKYLRLEGFADDGAGLVPETPITLTLLSGSASVTSALLVGKSILSLSREGTEYYQDVAVGDLKFTFNSGTGTVTFANIADPNNETIGVLYGLAGTSSGNFFSFDDTLITAMITEARMWCEKYLGGDDLMIGLIPRTIEVWLTNGAGMMRIPGPVTSVLGDVVFSDRNGDAVTSEVFWVGTTFPKLQGGFTERVKLVYDAGYDTAPSWAKDAILAYVAWAYENRGEEEKKGSPERAAAICRPYRRIKLFA